MNDTYFVCYSVNKQLYDRTVTLDASYTGAELVSALRAAVHPDTQPDPSDGCKGQCSADCVIVNFIKL